MPTNWDWSVRQYLPCLQAHAQCILSYTSPRTVGPRVPLRAFARFQGLTHSAVAILCAKLNQRSEPLVARNKPVLNPELDIDELRLAFAQDQRVRIDHVLDQSFAKEVEAALKQSVPFEYIFHRQGLDYVVAEQKMAQLPPAEREKLQSELSELATQGVGFLYAGYRMEGRRLAGAPPILKRLFELVNTELLEKISLITDCPNIKDADGQFTRLTKGHYLTRHLDNVEEERRRLAYVLNFTRTWHPDWGGLLQFYENDGTPRDAWAPQFNSLALFDVRHVHSVTYVAPHAADPRFALTGWYHN
jgi:SM-20-related protein